VAVERAELRADCDRRMREAYVHARTVSMLCRAAVGRRLHPEDAARLQWMCDAREQCLEQMCYRADYWRRSWRQLRLAIG
jgi:hypothetical protein